MLNNILIGRYYPVKSKFHFMNSVTKLLCMIIFIASAVMINDIKIMTLLLLFTLLLIEMARLPRIICLKTIKSLFPIFLIVIGIYYFINGELIDLVNMLLRIFLTIIYITIFTSTTPQSDIAYALGILLFPLRIIGVPVAKLALYVSLKFRFISVAVDYNNQIIKAQTSRGGHSKLSTLEPTVRLTKRKKIILHEAMKIRLYNSNAKRTNFRVEFINLFDIFMLFMHVGILILIVMRGKML